MRTDKEWNDLMQEHELAYFKADVCLGSPSRSRSTRRGRYAMRCRRAPRRSTPH